MDSSSLAFVLLIFIDLGFWFAGLAMDVTPGARFRLRALACLLLLPILCVLLGWQWGCIVFFAGIWIAAIVSSYKPTSNYGNAA